MGVGPPEGGREPVAKEAARAPRHCPACSRPLAFIENGRIGGVWYEYFHWCSGGCGLYCFDCGAGRFVKLA